MSCVLEVVIIPVETKKLIFFFKFFLTFFFFFSSGFRVFGFSDFVFIELINYPEKNPIDFGTGDFDLHGAPKESKALTKLKEQALLSDAFLKVL